MVKPIVFFLSTCTCNIMKTKNLKSLFPLMIEFLTKVIFYTKGLVFVDIVTQEKLIVTQEKLNGTWK